MEQDMDQDTGKNETSVVSEEFGLDMASIDLLGELALADRAWLDRLYRQYREQYGYSLYAMPQLSRCRRRSVHGMIVLRCVLAAGHDPGCVF
jgi:hypothetical protein